MINLGQKGAYNNLYHRRNKRLLDLDEYKFCSKPYILIKQSRRYLRSSFNKHLFEDVSEGES